MAEDAQVLDFRVKELRREFTRGELSRLCDGIEQWLARERWRDIDDESKYVGRHKTQLEAIEFMLLAGVKELHTRVSAVDLGRPAGEVYQACSDYEQAALTLHRLWEFYKEKFDQRDDPQTGRLLRAADDVIWSCYRGAFESSRKLKLQKATPLPYVEPQHSPAAIHSGSPLPRSLRPGAEATFLNKYMAGLPASVLRLPPSCIDSPWWLVYVTHEVGHYVLKDLKYEDCFAELIEDAAKGKDVTGGDLAYWAGCGEEIFADLFAVLMAGPWAVWAIAEAEWGTQERMSKRKTEYPAPGVRLAMVAYAADKLMSPDGGQTLGDEGTKALHGVQVDRAQAAADIAVAERIVDLAFDPSPDNPCPMRKLCDFRPELYRKGGDVQRWGAALLGKGMMTRRRQLETARQVASGSLDAWARLRATPGLTAEAWEERRDALAEKTFEEIIKNTPPGTRAAPLVPAQPPPDGRQLAQTILDDIQTHL